MYQVFSSSLGGRSCIRPNSQSTINRELCHHDKQKAHGSEERSVETSTCSFLRLPLELCQSIYTCLPFLPASDRLASPRVCKLVRSEALRSLFQKSLNCAGKDLLFQFAQIYGPETLEGITAIKLRCIEVESVVIEPYLTRLVLGVAIGNRGHPHSLEVRKSIALQIDCKAISLPTSIVVRYFPMVGDLQPAGILQHCQDEFQRQRSCAILPEGIYVLSKIHILQSTR